MAATNQQQMADEIFSRLLSRLFLERSSLFCRLSLSLERAVQCFPTVAGPVDTLPFLSTWHGDFIASAESGVFREPLAQTLASALLAERDADADSDSLLPVVAALRSLPAPAAVHWRQLTAEAPHAKPQSDERKSREHKEAEPTAITAGLPDPIASPHAACDSALDNIFPPSLSTRLRQVLRDSLTGLCSLADTLAPKWYVLLFSLLHATVLMRVLLFTVRCASISFDMTDMGDAALGHDSAQAAAPLAASSSEAVGREKRPDGGAVAVAGTVVLDPDPVSQLEEFVPHLFVIRPSASVLLSVDNPQVEHLVVSFSLRSKPSFALRFFADEHMTVFLREVYHSASDEENQPVSPIVVPNPVYVCAGTIGSLQREKLSKEELTREVYVVSVSPATLSSLQVVAFLCETVVAASQRICAQMSPADVGSGGAAPPSPLQWQCCHLLHSVVQYLGAFAAQQYDASPCLQHFKIIVFETLSRALCQLFASFPASLVTADSLSAASQLYAPWVQLRFEWVEAVVAEAAARCPVETGQGVLPRFSPYLQSLCELLVVAYRYEQRLMLALSLSAARAQSGGGVDSVDVFGLQASCRERGIISNLLHARLPVVLCLHQSTLPVMLRLRTPAAAPVKARAADEKQLPVVEPLSVGAVAVGVADESTGAMRSLAHVQGPSTAAPTDNNDIDRDPAVVEVSEAQSSNALLLTWEWETKGCQCALCLEMATQKQVDGVARHLLNWNIPAHHSKPRSVLLDPLVWNPHSSQSSAAPPGAAASDFELSKAKSAPSCVGPAHRSSPVRPSSTLPEGSPQRLAPLGWSRSHRVAMFDQLLDATAAAAAPSAADEQPPEITLQRQAAVGAGEEVLKPAALLSGSTSAAVAASVSAATDGWSSPSFKHTMLGQLNTALARMPPNQLRRKVGDSPWKIIFSGRVVCLFGVSGNWCTCCVVTSHFSLSLFLLLSVSFSHYTVLYQPVSLPIYLCNARACCARRLCGPGQRRLAWTVPAGIVRDQLVRDASGVGAPTGQGERQRGGNEA